MRFILYVTRIVNEKFLLFYYEIWVSMFNNKITLIQYKSFNKVGESYKNTNPVSSSYPLSNSARDAAFKGHLPKFKQPFKTKLIFKGKKNTITKNKELPFSNKVKVAYSLKGERDGSLVSYMDDVIAAAKSRFNSGKITEAELNSQISKIKDYYESAKICLPKFRHQP